MWYFVIYLILLRQIRPDIDTVSLSCTVKCSLSCRRMRRICPQVGLFWQETKNCGCIQSWTELSASLKSSSVSWVIPYWKENIFHVQKSNYELFFNQKVTTYYSTYLSNWIIHHEYQPIMPPWTTTHHYAQKLSYLSLSIGFHSRWSKEAAWITGYCSGTSQAWGKESSSEFWSREEQSAVPGLQRTQTIMFTFQWIVRKRCTWFQKGVKLRKTHFFNIKKQDYFLVSIFYSLRISKKKKRDQIKSLGSLHRPYFFDKYHSL